MTLLLGSPNDDPKPVSGLPVKHLKQSASKAEMNVHVIPSTVPAVVKSVDWNILHPQVVLRAIPFHYALVA